MKIFPVLVLACGVASQLPAQFGTNCTVREIPLAGAVEGALSKAAGDCQAELWPGEVTLVHQYRINVVQSGVLSVDLYSTAYTPYVVVLRPPLSRLAEQVALEPSAQAGGFVQTSRAKTMVSLPPGSYIIAVTAWGTNASYTGYAEGAYKLTTTFEPLRQCGIRELKLGEIVQGDFAKPTCRELDLQTPSSSKAGVERYRLAIEQRGILTVAVTSTLNSQTGISLRPYDSANREVTSGSQSLEGLKLVYTTSIDAGSYVLDLRAEPWLGTGAFTLTATFQPINVGACQARTLRLNNEEVVGELKATGCRFLEIRAGSSDQSVTDVYMVSVAARGVLSIGLRSNIAWVVADLMLYEQPGRLISQRRYYGGTPEIQLAASLDPGAYYVYVRAVEQATGEYRLRAAFGAQRACAPRSLGFGETVSGALTVEGCRVLDRTIPSADASPSAAFTLSVTQRGLLTLDLAASFPLEASLLLVAPDGSTVSSKLPARGGALDARLETAVGPGVYGVEVRGLGTTAPYAQTGAYTLKTAFQELAPRPCSTRDLGLNETVAGALGASSCRPMDVFPASTLLTPLDQYRIAVAEAGVLTIDLASSDFDAHLFFYSASLSLVASDDNGGGGKNARLVVSLEPGTYIIHARTADGRTGAYTLRTSFQTATPATCPVTDILVGGVVPGVLSTSDCRMLDLQRPSSNAAFVDRYRVTTTQRGVLTLELGSQDFTPTLVVYDSRSRWLASGTGSTRASAQVMVSLEAGAYMVFASSVGSRTGAYTLRSSLRPMASACPVIEVAAGATVSGSLAETACRVLDLAAPSSNTAYVSQYRVTAPRRGVLTVEVEASSFDPAVRLNDAELRSIAWSYGRRGTVTRAVATVDAAPYIVYVSSSGTGAFTLRTTFREVSAPDCAARPISLNESMAGSFEHGGCRRKEIVPSTTPAGDYTYAAQYALTVAERGVLSAEMDASAFRPLIVLYRPDFSVAAQSAFSVSAGGARLSAKVVPGQYVILAGEYNSDSVTAGAFTLRTSFQPAPPPCAVKEIGLEETVEDTLAAGECLLRDVVPESALESPAQQYRLEVAAAGVLQVELASTDFAALLYLRDAGGQAVAEASDPGDGSGARIGADVSPGGYIIVVTAARPASGRYTLKTAFQAAEPPPPASPARLSPSRPAVPVRDGGKIRTTPPRAM